MANRNGQGRPPGNASRPAPVVGLTRLRYTAQTMLSRSRG